ncbi:MAG: MotA/TolQ/ExbB proton channel family protein [Phycisphaeraceae bacterium]|nr:MotA/TolQ/ExbB proton channel family protein [Phycisphaeraceae bacterium]
MTRTMRCLLATALVLGAALPLHAAESVGGTMNVFRMFFNPIPKSPSVLDWIGVFQVWMLVLLSVIAVGMILSAAMKNSKGRILPGDIVGQLQEMIANKQFREARDLVQADHSFFGRLMDAAFTEAPNGLPAMERALDETNDLEVTRMLRPLEYLNVMGNVAPMLGLFGTVYGMIVAFQGLVEMGGKPDPGALAGGISTALVTTFWGLIIAMPCVTAYALIRNRIDAAASESLLVAEDILKQIGQPGRKAAPAAPTQTPTPAAKPRMTPKPDDKPGA